MVAPSILFLLEDPPSSGPCPCLPPLAPACCLQILPAAGGVALPMLPLNKPTCTPPTRPAGLQVLQQAVCPERRRGFDGAVSALASVTEVVISNDLQVARVYLSIYRQARRSCAVCVWGGVSGVNALGQSCCVRAVVVCGVEGLPLHLQASQGLSQGLCSLVHCGTWRGVHALGQSCCVSLGSSCGWRLGHALVVLLVAKASAGACCRQAAHPQPNHVSMAVPPCHLRRWQPAMAATALDGRLLPARRRLTAAMNWGRPLPLLASSGWRATSASTSGARCARVDHEHTAHGGGSSCQHGKGWVAVEAGTAMLAVAPGCWIIEPTASTHPQHQASFAAPPFNTFHNSTLPPCIT